MDIRNVFTLGNGAAGFAIMAVDHWLESLDPDLLKRPAVTKARPFLPLVLGVLSGALSLVGDAQPLGARLVLGALVGIVASQTHGYAHNLTEEKDE